MWPAQQKPVMYVCTQKEIHFISPAYSSTKICTAPLWVHMDVICHSHSNLAICVVSPPTPYLCWPKIHVFLLKIIRKSPKSGIIHLPGVIAAARCLRRRAVHSIA